MTTFPDGFRALVIGASGGIGQAFVQALQADPRCASVAALSRQSVPRIDFDDEATVANAAKVLAADGKFHLIIHAAGLLHNADFMPEKRLADLNYAQLESTFRANTFGPALVLRHFCPLLDGRRGVLAVISARVGSIEDNRLGGLYSYRASKAALNMLLKTAAIEIKRYNANAVLVSLHPGTVSTGLSRPFKGEQIGRPALLAAHEMLVVLDGVTAADTGSFVSYNGEHLPW